MLKTVTLKYINQKLFIQKCLKYHKSYRVSTESAHFYTILGEGEGILKTTYITEVKTIGHSIIFRFFFSHEVPELQLPSWSISGRLLLSTKEFLMVKKMLHSQRHIFICVANKKHGLFMDKNYRDLKILSQIYLY